MWYVDRSVGEQAAKAKTHPVEEGVESTGDNDETVGKITVEQWTWQGLW